MNKIKIALIVFCLFAFAVRLSNIDKGISIQNDKIKRLELKIESQNELIRLNDEKCSRTRSELNDIYDAMNDMDTLERCNEAISESIKLGVLVK